MCYFYIALLLFGADPRWETALRSKRTISAKTLVMTRARCEYRELYSQSKLHYGQRPLDQSLARSLISKVATFRALVFETSVARPRGPSVLIIFRHRHPTSPSWQASMACVGCHRVLVALKLTASPFSASTRWTVVVDERGAVLDQLQFEPQDFYIASLGNTDIQ